MKRLMLILAACGPVWGGCLPVSGDRILGKDLAIAMPAFEKLPPAMTVGFVPAPGMKRVFTVAELDRIARANGIALTNPAESCFELPVQALSSEEVMNAMRSSLPAGAELAIVELQKSEVPLGDLEFALSGLEPAAAAGAQLWRGSVRYSATRRVSVWARVTVSQRMGGVVAARDLPAGIPIDAASVRLEKWSGPLVRERIAAAIADVTGRAPKKAVKAGALIPIALLEDPAAVRRGDAVSVEVRSGPARLLFSAVAEKAARDGDLMELRNPSTGKTFRARLEGTKAIVTVAPGAGL